MAEEKKELGFLDHLEELRGRIIKSIISILLFSIIAYVFSDRLLDFITRPIDEVYFMAPTEALSTRIKISLIAGIIVSVAGIFYHMWKFIAPGLFQREIKLIVPAVISSTVFFERTAGLASTSAEISPSGLAGSTPTFI